MEMSKMQLLPLRVRFLGEDVGFRLRLNELNDDYNNWLFFRGDYADDEAKNEVVEQTLIDGDSAGAVVAVPRERSRTSTEVIVRLVADWELTDNGVPVPVTEEIVSSLNLTFKNAICEKIFETLDTKKLSAAPSHWLAGSARARK